jgi:hypothetical protein
MINYINGNACISVYDDGTREILYDDTLKLEYPLNIDIRVSNRCSFGLNPKTGKAFCTFCHESQRTDGNECDYNVLKSKLVELPSGIEFAIGANNITSGLVEFIEWCKAKGNIVNLTINQGHIKRDSVRLKYLIDNALISGLGVSYRSGLTFDVPTEILEYPHTVFHVICGIDKFADVENLKSHGVRKVLLLGEKNFGFNKGKVDLTSRRHKEWYWWVHKLFTIYDVVSFDNLALEQLNIRRFFSQDNWEIFNQGEHSFYVDAVRGIFAPSSRSSESTDWSTISAKDYFSLIDK